MSQNEEVLRRRMAALEAAESEMTPVFEEAQKVLDAVGTGATPTFAHWVPKEKLKAPTSAVLIFLAAVVFGYLKIELDTGSEPDDQPIPAFSQTELADLRRMVPDTQKKIAHMQTVLAARAVAHGPFVSMPVALKLQQAVRGGTEDRRPVQGNVLAWLNVGLAGCTTRERAAAEHALHQLCRLANTSLPPMGQAEWSAPAADQGRAVLMKRCKAKGITLPHSPLMPPDKPRR